MVVASARPRARLVLIVLATVKAVSVRGVPYVLLTSSTAKCFSVDTVHDTTLQIDFQAPDLVLPDEADAEARPDEASSPESVGKEGLDSIYNANMQRKLEDMKRNARKMRDMNILIYQREYGTNASRNPRQQTGTGKIRHQLEKRTGQIEFVTADYDGYIEVCLQSFSAKQDAPSRVSVSITKRRPDFENSQSAAAGKPLEEIEKEANLLIGQTSRISQDLLRMQSRAEELQKDAEYSKEREVSFHDQSISLNRAVRYWPIFRIFIVMTGGVLQVNHVVQYMKRRRIY